MKNYDRTYCPYCGERFPFNPIKKSVIRDWYKHFEKCKKNKKDLAHFIRTKPNLSEQKYYHTWLRKET